MDGVSAIGSSLSLSQAYLLASREAESLYAPPAQSGEPSPIGGLDAINRADPATAEDLMLHFISHVDADCFISLLQILDSLPDDERDRAEYKRFCRQLHDVLVIPLPPEPRQIGAPEDPLR